jgi:hypothetical protein
MTVPAYLPVYVLSGSILIIAALLFGLARTPVTPIWTLADRAQALRAAAIILIGWFTAAFVLGSIGTYAAASDRMPTMPFGIFVPILIGTVMIFRSQALARVIDAVPQSWLVGVQLYRALGVIFLILLGAGKLPGLFAWPAGLGDVLVGILAPVIAIAYARAPSQNADLVAAWNVFGLADLAVAVATGFLTSPSPFQLFAFDAPNELVSQFPLVLIPTFLVPVSVLLHFASLAKLRRHISPEQSPQEVFASRA